jgi:hypothetical protein
MRAGIAIGAVLALATGCAQMELVPEFPQPLPPAEAAVTVPTPTAAPGTGIEVRGTGFPANTTVDIGIGQPASEFSTIGQGSVDAEGRITTTVTVPSWAMRGLPYVIVMSAAGAEPRAVSEPFVVGAPGDSISVQGRLTDEGVECPAMRGPAGELYTLAISDLEYGPGTEVRVEGTIAEVATCMQGTTIQVSSIQRR